MGDDHGEDEEEEDAVVSPSNAAVEKKAVVVVVSNAHVTEFAVFGEVRWEQLTVWTEPVMTLVVLDQVSDAGKPWVRVCSVQGPWVLGQNFTEQTQD